MNYCKVATFALPAIALSSLVACGKKKFEPGPIEREQIDAVGVAFQKPKNVVAKVAGNVVTLTADGYPLVTITAKDTNDTSMTGSVGESGMGKVSRRIMAPKREIVCETSDAGAFEAQIKELCKSVENTKAVARNPHASLREVTSKNLKNEAAFKVAAQDAVAVATKCYAEWNGKGPKNQAYGFNYNVLIDAAGAKSENSSASTGGEGESPYEFMRTCLIPTLAALPIESAGGPAEADVSFKFDDY